MTASQALQHPWFNLMEESKDGGGLISSQYQEFSSQRKRVQRMKGKNDILTRTPVLTGVKRKDLPPETPIRQNDTTPRAINTPVVKTMTNDTSHK